MRNINNSKLRIIPLGGLEQIGMNITAFEFEDSIVVVDCGLSFPEDDMLGIDLVIPDITYLKENIEKVKGFVITHGHEDHIGALPYVLKEINVPIYATKLTIGLIENKLREHELLNRVKAWLEDGKMAISFTTDDEDEQEWIQNVFDFGDSSVRESMTPRSDMDALDIESTDGEILEMIQETGRSRFPVYEESVDTILGILNVRDYLLDRNAGKNTALKDLLRPAYFVPETMKADNLFKEMQKEKVHIAVVVDEYGGTEGIITMEDLLEEIVGNIYDEFDKAEQPEIVPLGENQWRIAGSTPISTLVDDLELPLPESDDYDTLGGLIVTRLNAIPKDGEQFDMEIDGVALHIEKIEDHRIESVVATLLPKEEPEEK